MLLLPWFGTGGGQTHNLQGTAAAVATATPKLTRVARMAVSAPAVASASPHLSRILRGAGTLAAVLTASATMALQKALSGLISAVASMVAPALLIFRLGGAAQATSGATGSLTRVVTLSGQIECSFDLEAQTRLRVRCRPEGALVVGGKRYVWSGNNLTYLEPARRGWIK